MYGKPKGSKVHYAVGLALMSVLCALLLAAHYRDFSPRRLAIYLAISGGVAVLIGIPGLLITGSTHKHYLARAGAAALLLTAVGFALVRFVVPSGEAGIGLMVIVNIGAVFGFLMIVASLGVGLVKSRRNKSRRQD
jgi:hypothetical protein